MSNIYLSDNTEIQIKYLDLRNLIYLNSLEPGRKYRIIDYETTTNETNTASAGHKFDLVVTATSTNTLDYKANAVKHKNENYFDNSQLDKWQIWYTIFNDHNLYSWICPDYGADEITYIKVPIEDIPDYYRAQIDIYSEWGFYPFNEGSKTVFAFSKDGEDIVGDLIINNISLSDGYVSVNDRVELYDAQRDEISYSKVTYIKSNINLNYTGSPKGVIYRMIDEYGNDCPYDFKNIKFKIQTDDISFLPQTESTYYWFYTFSTTIDDEEEDLSIVGNIGNITNDVEEHDGVSNNIIGVFSETHETQAIRKLNFNIFYLPEGYEWDFFGCYNNVLSNNCNHNIFHGNARNNFLGYNCYTNIFNRYCFNNIFKNECYNNILGQSCFNNTFENNCSRNIFGNSCSNNTFGNNCLNNIFGNNCAQNRFENSCLYNTFGNNCSSNILENSCLNIKLGIFSENIFITKDYVRYCKFKSGTAYVTLTTTKTTSTNNYLQNCIVDQSCSGNNKKYIYLSVDTINQDYESIFKMNPDYIYIIEKNYLTFTAEEANSTIQLTTHGSPDNITLEYNINNTNWNIYTINDIITLEHVGDYVEFKGNNTTICKDVSNYYKFIMSGKISANGDITTLLNKLGEISVPKNCYAYIFSGCTSLTQAPELPAINVEEWGYYHMFSGCTSLTQAPQLPAINISKWSYADMFKGCTSLTQAPQLPVINLVEYCYAYMFQGCTSLAQAPELPATQLAARCYDSMFRDCTSLIQAPQLNVTTLANGCYSAMFSGCTSLMQAPQLPATTLTSSCYSSMFSGCTSLTQAPQLPATALISWCYSSMFSDCTSLNSVTCLATSGIDENRSTMGWLYNVSASGTFTKANGVTWPTGSNGIPNGWTIEISNE